MEAQITHGGPARLLNGKGDISCNKNKRRHAPAVSLALSLSLSFSLFPGYPAERDREAYKGDSNSGFLAAESIENELMQRQEPQQQQEQQQEQQQMNTTSPRYLIHIIRSIVTQARTLFVICLYSLSIPLSTSSGSICMRCTYIPIDPKTILGRLSPRR